MKNTEQEEKETSPRKRPEVIIIGHVGCGTTVLTSAIATAEALMKKNGKEIVVVDSIEKLEKVTGVKLTPEQIEELKDERKPISEIIKPEPYTLRAHSFTELQSASVYDSTEHNPWPSPKGRRGKKKF